MSESEEIQEFSVTIDKHTKTIDFDNGGSWENNTWFSIEFKDLDKWIEFLQHLKEKVKDE